ncbi:MAG: hypothetical protein ACLRM9_06810 [Collinsella aerofaciens]
MAAVFEHVSDQVVEANAAVEEARAAEGDAAGEIARLRASAAPCCPRSAVWSKAPTMPRSSACVLQAP